MDKHHIEQNVYDTKLRCEKCGTPLYLSEIGVAVVRDSLKRIGLAGLVCICGHVQFVGPGFKPIQPGLQN